MKKIIYLVAVITLLNACRKKEQEEPQPELKNSIPEFYKPALEAEYGKNIPDFVLIANNDQKIANPQDLDFNPTRANELWVINKGTEPSGGSTVMFTNVGMPGQNFEYRKDGNAWHFMSLPSALSFSNTGNWANSANVLDANHNGGTFAGPALWSGNLSIYAQPSGGNGSHLDMLHGSPYSMGIETEKDNAYWVFDGYNKHIVRYDFGGDHGPGNDDHSDGKIHRYKEVSVKRIAAVPSHLVLDKEKKWLYIVDGGNRRVLRMDITTGSKLKDLPLINETLAEHWEISNVTWEEFILPSFGLKQPCGIDIKDNRLFVSDYETGEIFCFDVKTKQLLVKINTGKAGITGISIDNNNRLWYVNSTSNELFKIEPK